MEYLFLFPLMQKSWKSINKCKTCSRKATGLFFLGHGVDKYQLLNLISDIKLTTMSPCFAFSSFTVSFHNALFFYKLKHATWLILGILLQNVTEFLRVSTSTFLQPLLCIFTIFLTLISLWRCFFERRNFGF